MAMTSLEDYRLGVWQEKQIPVELYCERMGTLPNHFARDWGREHEAIMRNISKWDKEGIGQISRMIRSLRGPTDPEDRPSEVLKDIA